MAVDTHFSEFSPKTDPSYLSTVRLVHHCAAISATAELLAKRSEK